MVVHLFGAISSLACANFALLKTAHDNSEYFPLEVVNTVRKNVYMDKCLKSLLSETEAVTHVGVGQLHVHILLSRGGFLITKWLCNNCEILEVIPGIEHEKDIKQLDLGKDKLPI